MHIEFLVEDLSTQILLENLVDKIIKNNHTWKIHSYKGIGRIPKNMRGIIDPKKRILLDRLPKLLNGYGKTFFGYSDDYQAVVIIVTDLDKRNLKEYLLELHDVLNNCSHKPDAEFCIAIEESEAWLLGDIGAIKKAYKRAKQRILSAYVNDSICGTWEKLADAIYLGGALELKKGGWQSVGKIKSEWAEKITPFMDINKNKSDSFCYFRDTLKSIDKL